MSAIPALIHAALTELRSELKPIQSLRIEVYFAAADPAVVDVVHGLTGVPNTLEVLAADGPVYTAQGVWADREIAWLRAANANTRAIVRFRIEKE